MCNSCSELLKLLHSTIKCGPSSIHNQEHVNNPSSIQHTSSSNFNSSRIHQQLQTIKLIKISTIKIKKINQISKLPKFKYKKMMSTGEDKQWRAWRLIIGAVGGIRAFRGGGHVRRHWEYESESRRRKWRFEKSGSRYMEWGGIYSGPHSSLRRCPRLRDSLQSLSTTQFSTLSLFYFIFLFLFE